MANDLLINGRFNDQISPALKALESGIIRIVGAVSAMTTAVATVGAPIAMATEYQKQLLEVKKTTDYTREATASLGRGLLDLSKNINVTANDLAKIAALGGQLGIGDSGAGALLTFTEEIARAVTALDVNAELAATSLGKLRNIFNIPPEQFRNVIGVINQISNVSTAKPEELFDILRRIGSLGGSVSVDQATALAAVMIDLGLTAETAGTSLTKVFADMKASAGDFANFVGVSTNEWSQLVERDGVGALKLYLNTLNKMPPAIAAATKAQLTGEGRIFGLITKLQEEQAKGGGLLDLRLFAAADEMQAGTSALKEQQSVLSGLSAQWQIFKNRVAALFIAAGEQTLAPLTQAIRYLGSALSDQTAVDAFVATAKSIVEAFSQIAQAVVRVTSVLSGLGLDWGKVLGLVAILGVIQGLKGAAAAYLFLSTSTKKAAADTSAAGVSQSNMLNPLAAVSGGLTALAERWTASAVAARLSTAAQIAETQRLAVAQRVAETQAALGAYRQQANAYRAQFIQPLVPKVVAGTATAAETAQFKARLANYQAMTTSMNAIAQGRLGVETVIAQGITSVNNAQIRARLTAVQAALAVEEAALLRLAAVQATADAAYAAGVPQIPASTPGIFSRMAQAISAIRQQGLGAYMADAAGKTDLLAAASGRASRAAVVTASALTLVGRAVASTVGFFFRWVSVAAVVGTLVVSLLEMVGVLDKVKDGAWAVLKAFGVKTRPAFLDTGNAEAERIRQQRVYQDIAADKQKFEQQFGTLNIPVTVEVKGQEKFEASLAKVAERVKTTVDGLTPKLEFRLDKPNEASDSALVMVGIVDKLQAGYAGTSAELEKLTASEGKLDRAVTRTGNAFTKTKGAVDALVEQGHAVPQSMFDELAAAEKAYATATKARAAFANSKVVSNTEAVGAVQMGEMERAARSLFAFFDEKSLADVFTKGEDGGESYIVTLNKIGVRQAQLKADAAKLQITDITAPVDTAGKTEEEIANIRAITQEYAALSGKAVEVKTALYNLPSLEKILPNKSVRVDFLDKITANAQGLTKEFYNLVKVYGETVQTLAKGTGVNTLPAGTSVSSVATTIAFALEAKRAAETMATVFKAKAEDANGALARAIDASKQRLTEYAAFSTRIARNVVGQQDRASTQTATRAIDDGSATRSAGLNAAKSLENDILNMIKEEGYVNQNDIAARLQGLETAAMYSRDQLGRMLYSGDITRAQYDQEIKAIDVNLSKQREMLGYYYDRAGISKEEAAAIQRTLDLKYKAAERKIVDSTEADKATLGIDAISTAFTRLQASSAKSAAELQYVNDALSKGASGNEAVNLLQRRDKAQADLTASLGLMRAEAEKFSSVDPIAGKLLITPSEVQQMQDVVKRFTDIQNSVGLTTASVEKGIFTQAGNEAAAAVAQWQSVIDVQANAAQSLKLAQGKLAAYIAQARQMPEVQAEIAKLTETLANIGTGVAPKLDKDTITAQIQEISKQAEGIKVEIQADMVVGKGVMEQVEKDLRGAVSQGISGAAADTKTTPITLDAKLNIVATSGEVTVQVNSAKKDGGYIQAFAGGGDVRGAGTGRSDEILSWLSHGEYVMDATSVRMFGSGFFRTLQALAQRGSNLEGLRSSLQGFASGGPVSIPGLSQFLPAEGLQSIANAGGAGGMSLDINMNGVRRSRVQGSREQLNGLVSAIRDIQKGMA